MKVKRALISVSDKTGLVDFAYGLSKLGIELVSTGGTKRVLVEAGLAAVDVEDITGYPEMLDGRVKTLHPKIHGAILAVRGKESHMKELQSMDITPIDMVVVNLYPFAKTVAKEGVTLEEVVENIDIGGPTLIRSAAKNFESVCVVVDPGNYDMILRELREDDGCISLETCQRLAFEAFYHTSQYDWMIYQYLKGLMGVEAEDFPEIFGPRLEKVCNLRYGENAHQRAAFYKDKGVKGSCIANAIQLQGKELTFNNIYDLNAAFELVKEFEEPAVVVIKHTNPCGVALGEEIVEAFESAYQADPVSAFGGIIGFNRVVDKAAAAAISGVHVDALIAPDYDEEARAILRGKENLIVLKADEWRGKGQPTKYYDIKGVVGGLLIQESDGLVVDEAKLKVVSQRTPTDEELEALYFAFRVVKHVKSNAIVVAKGGVTLGIGAGQMNRVGAVKIAVEQAGEEAKGAVLASDGFFPFRDGIDEAAKAGISAIIQPGGSMRDEECIDAADENGIAMVFTGIRHFKH